MAVQTQLSVGYPQSVAIGGIVALPGAGCYLTAIANGAGAATIAFSNDGTNFGPEITCAQATPFASLVSYAFARVSVVASTLKAQRV